MKNKVAIITGSSSGIGKEIAHLFALRGSKVVINGRSEEKTSRVVQEIREKGGDAIGFPLGIHDVHSANKLIDFAIEHYDQVNILINNAGVTKQRSPEEFTPSQWSAIIETNLNVPFFCAQSVFPYMKEVGGGVIVNTSSIAGMLSKFRRSAYSASKAGLDGLTRSLAVEWAKDNIRVNAVAPGVILTEPVKKMIEKNSYGKSEKEMAMSVPLGRLGTTEEVAEVVYFLCTPAANYITGQVLYVDGGASVYRT